MINLSGVDGSGSAEGLLLPQNAGDCSGATGEGQICWDSTGNTLSIGTNPGTVTLTSAASTITRTVVLPADSWYMQGSAALVTNTALVSGGLVEPYITITDSDSDGFPDRLDIDAGSQIIFDRELALTVSIFGCRARL